MRGLSVFSTAEAVGKEFRYILAAAHCIAGSRAPVSVRYGHIIT